MVAKYGGEADDEWQGDGPRHRLGSRHRRRQ